MHSQERGKEKPSEDPLMSLKAPLVFCSLMFTN